MPSIKEHIKSSKRRSGREYKEVHEWLDGSGLSYSERLSRHGIMNLRRNMRETGRMFGEDGRMEHLHHLEEDYGGKGLFGTAVRIAMLWERIRVWW